MAEPEKFEPRRLTEEELKARKRRNLWLALALGAFVVAVLAITMIKLSQGAAMPDGGF
ncbi:MAG: hypothetical protein MRY64_05665 [Hyphomonadaceae bacterium]|nr:hypothetical protein [Hyphomonadaceae bacterium]